MSQPVTDRPVTVADLKRTAGEVRGEHLVKSPALGWQGRLASASAPVLVLGAQPGVGASTVALAMADALAALGEPSAGRGVQLIDLAPREASGLLCAPDRELGVQQSGWLIARRGMTTVERVASSTAELDALPPLRPEACRRMVVDAGRPAEVFLSAEGWIRELFDGARPVMVCHASVPGVRRAEAVLPELPGDPLVVSVGVRRWPGPVLASCGPGLRAAHASRRVFCIPADRRLAVEGIDDRVLPRKVVAVAVRIVSELQPQGSARASKDVKGRRPWL